MGRRDAEEGAVSVLSSPRSRTPPDFHGVLSEGERPMEKGRSASLPDAADGRGAKWVVSESLVHE